ncbi:uncharacterized protein LOC135833624 [Planococcus citri]|uniref:uncharacterized protein LOC135833624 n=1 Tax=Planococcus citri TaxID=170843 RepID=UPI0031F8F582
MKYEYLFFIGTLLWISSNSQVECLWEKIFGQSFTETISSFFSTASNAEFPSLVLAVDKSMNCFIANVPVVTNRMGSNFNKFLFACPAETEAERAIDYRDSPTERSLFIKKSYENPINNIKDKKKAQALAQDMSEFDKKDSQFIEYFCENPIIPSIKYVSSVIENGLEIEYHLVGFKVYVKDQKDLKVEEYGKKFLKLSQDFAWFNLLIIRFDRNGGNVLSVASEMYNDRMNISPPKTDSSADDKNIEDSLWEKYFYKDKNYEITFTYTVDNQRVVLESLFNPTPILNTYLDPAEDRKLVKVHLAPVNSFVNPLLRQASRTYGNIAPMWHVIKTNAWFKVEQYVQHLVQAVYGIYVITGTYGTYTMFCGQTCQREIYLEANKNVRVPLAFWKIVMYTKKAKQFYNILIVTVNNPYEYVPNVLCETSQCEELGWGHVKQSNFAMGRTSCCKLTEDILRKLQISNSVKLEHDLDLKRLLHWENEKLTLNVEKFTEDQASKSIDRTIRADNPEYRNEKISLDSELRSKNKDKNDEISFTGVVSTFWNSVSPMLYTYLPNFSGNKNGDIEVEKPK